MSKINNPVCSCGNVTDFGSQGRDLVCTECHALVPTFVDVPSVDDAKAIIEQLGWDSVGSVTYHDKTTKFNCGGRDIATYNRTMQQLNIVR